MAELEGIPVGQIRFDLVENELLVSLSVASEYSCRGVGGVMICRACSKAHTHFPGRKIVAMVKNSNQSSKSVFQKAGFFATSHLMQGNGKYVRYEYREGA